jgi:hypothetical protein
LRPVVRVVVQVAEVAPVGLLPVCETRLHGLKYPICGDAWPVVISEANVAVHLKLTAALSVVRWRQLLELSGSSQLNLS